MNDATQTNPSYHVLARKYRPQTFDDLIGQEPMVTTLTNAFELNRIAQAYMLTGVRGVGKTTTARILARALNYQTDHIDHPDVHLNMKGVHCDAIIKSNHLDVIEMDAASHTGIDDIREIIDSVKYKPAAARYKVYIIDEVHMLSKSAFNGLLKTLEEPPPHVKFIFATTEIRKVPVTILSRCQRFDLRRIAQETMISFLQEVARKENVVVDEAALHLISRASEGSVRDALSLLDQAISHGAGTVNHNELRAMLGLADRERVVELFSLVMSGSAHQALLELKEQYDNGADPLIVLNDLAEFTHLVTTAKVAEGVPVEQAHSDRERENAMEFAGQLSIRVLSRAWQMLLSGIKEVETARKPLAAADMVIVRLCYVADLPTLDEGLRLVRKRREEDVSALSSVHAPEIKSSPSRPQEAVTTQSRLVTANQTEQGPVIPQQPSRLINRFEDFVALAERYRDLAFRYALERHVHLIAFQHGRIEFSPGPDAPRNLATTIKARLKQWSQTDWQVIVTHEKGGCSLFEQRAAQELERQRDVSENPVVAAALKQFPGSKVVNVSFRCNEGSVLAPAPRDLDDTDPDKRKGETS